MSTLEDRVGVVRLVQLTAATAALQGIIADLAPAALDDAGLTELARQHFQLRRVRDQVFPSSLFAEPAWDILLDLFICNRSGRRLTVSALGPIAGVPPTTALRHIDALLDHKLVERRPCPCDGRRVFIDLTNDAMRKIGALFDAK